MPKWLLPWLFPLGLLVVVIAIAISTILAIVLAVVAGLVGIPFAYRAYMDNRPNSGGGDKPPRSDPPNNRSLLR